MKRIGIWVICLVVLLSLSGCAASGEKRVLACYERHMDELKADMVSHFENGEPLSFSVPGVTVNEWPGEHTIVEYIVTGAGLNAQYAGFFYSRDDVPASFQNAGETLSALCDGEWEWCGEGDNRGYVRRIEPNWFYFEANF